VTREESVKLREGDFWANDYDYPRDEWQREVEDGDTQRGYWDWVDASREYHAHRARLGILSKAPMKEPKEGRTRADELWGEYPCKRIEVICNRQRSVFDSLDYGTLRCVIADDRILILSRQCSYGPVASFPYLTFGVVCTPVGFKRACEEDYEADEDEASKIDEDT